MRKGLPAVTTESDRNVLAALISVVDDGNWPTPLEKLGRYEVHLDRKLERTLTMLIRLRELHNTATPS
ncbi:MAG TPA: hypothetical protein VKB96_01820 [Gammaproteobacteria bacterium]|nr:hypothetical protein [Gammaproteobacteria bacterium]